MIETPQQIFDYEVWKLATDVLKIKGITNISWAEFKEYLLIAQEAVCIKRGYVIDSNIPIIEDDPDEEEEE